MKQHVLIVSKSELLESVIPIVEESAGAELQHVESAAQALEFLSALRPELLVLVHPLEDSDALTFWSELRDRLEPGELPMTVVLSSLGDRPSVEPLEYAGVPVVSLDRTDTELAADLMRFLRQAPRPAVRVMVRMTVELEAGNLLRVAQALNASSSGLFVRTKDELPPGTELELRIEVPGQEDPVSARGVVVRKAVKSVEGSDGVGVRFAEMPPADRKRFEAFLLDQIESLAV